MEKFKLSDNRTLCYVDYFKQNKKVILFIHGTPSDHSSFLNLPDFPFINDYRIICIDRPGYGDSDLNTKYGYSALTNDIKELTEALGINEFYIEAVSGGAPWALAISANLPRQVKGVILVSPMGPLTENVFNQVNSINQKIYSLTKTKPWLVKVMLSLFGLILKYFSGWYLNKIKSKLSAPDIRDLKNEKVRYAVQTTLKNSVKKTSFGFYQDLINQTNPYNFEFKDIKCPVVVYQSNQDLTTPKAIGEYYNKSLPIVKTHFIEDAGHLWHSLHMNDIIRDSLNEIKEMSITNKNLSLKDNSL